MDISQIADGLYVASAFYPPDDDMPAQAVMLDVDTLLDTPLGKNGEAELERFASATQLLRSQGYNVVLRCDAGRNRSSAVAALCLITEGMKPNVAIGIVRQARRDPLRRSGGIALTNDSFVAYLQARTPVPLTSSGEGRD